LAIPDQERHHRRPRTDKVHRVVRAKAARAAAIDVVAADAVAAAKVVKAAKVVRAAVKAASHAVRPEPSTRP
jgi:hypothetical protein